MRTALAIAVLAVCLAASAAFVVQDPNFGIHTAIPDIIGAALTFNTAGDLFVYDAQRNPAGCLYKFPGAANTAPFTTIPFSYGSGCAGGVSVSQGFAAIIATDTGRLYLSNGFEIDPNTGATIRKAFMNCGAQHGIARDPRDGALFFSNYNERKVYRVDNPDVHPETQNPCLHPPFADTGADANTGIDGLTVGPDGLVYMAGYDASTFLVYSAYSTSTPTGTKIGSTSTGRTAGAGPDGISICFGDGVSFAITADSGAQVLHRFNLTGPGGAPSYAVSTLVAGTGGYNDWTAVDPKGCIWGSTINGVAGIYRLSNADGSCMQCAAPQGPSDGCNCAEVVNVQHGATTASANAQGPCVAINFL